MMNNIERAIDKIKTGTMGWDDMEVITVAALREVQAWRIYRERHLHNKVRYPRGDSLNAKLAELLGEQE